MATAETARLIAELSLKDKLTPAVNKAIASTDRLEASVNRTAAKIGRDLGAGVGAAARNIERLAVAGAALAIGGGAAAVKWAGDFQAGMQTINTVSFATAGQLAAAGDALRATFRETGQSMSDLQSAEYDLVSAGIRLADSQAGVDVAVKLGIGGLGTTAEAVDVLTTAVNSYNLKAADGSVATATWTRVSDELAQAVADGKVKLSEIAASYAQVAPVAAQAGVSTGEIAAALGYLTAKGNPAADVMTQMNRAIIELSKPKGDMAKVLDTLGKTGTQLISEHGLAGALEIIRAQAAKMKIPFVDLFGRIEAYKFALQTTGPNSAGFTAELDKIAKSAGMTTAQFDERAQGFNYQLGVLKANVQDAGITIGTELLPQLASLAKEGSDFLRGHQQDIASFAKGLAGGFKEAVAWARQLDWGGIATALKSVAGFGKALAEGFMAMPSEAKAILLGLFGLNKLTGGAVVKIGVDLATPFASALARAGIGKLFVQPVLVTNPGAIGGVGGAAAGSGIAGAVMRVALVAVAAGVAVELAAALGQQSTDIQQQGAGLVSGTKLNAPKMTRQEITAALAQIDEQKLGGFGLNALALVVTNPLNHGMDNLASVERDLRAQLAAMDLGNARGGQGLSGKGIDDSLKTVMGGTERNTGKAADDIARLPRYLDQLHTDFQKQLGILKTSKDPAAIAAAAAKASKAITAGVGSVATTKGLLATLRADRATAVKAGATPAQISAIDAAIKAVQAKIAPREWVASQLTAARKVAASGESQKQKLADLKAIQGRLLADGATQAANQVGKLIAINSSVQAVKAAVNAIPMLGTAGNPGKTVDDRTPPTLHVTTTVSQSSVSRATRQSKASNPVGHTTQYMT